jgi:hypothetical protein
MKRTFLLVLIIALCSSLTGRAQQANIYASGLKAEQDGSSCLFSYTLNTDATSGSINIISGETTVGKPITDPDLLTKGTHSVTLDLGDLASGQYAWSMTVTAAANTGTEPVKFTGDQATLSFIYPRGLAIDNNTESPYFGRIYVADSDTTKKPNPEQKGLYVFNSDLSDAVGQGSTPLYKDVWTMSPASPMRLTVAPDSKVYITDWSDNASSGVYIMDPANPSAAPVPVFGGEVGAGGVATYEGTTIHGSISHCWVEGTGDGTKLYTFDEDIQAPGATGVMNIYRYDIGNLTTPWVTGPSAIAYDDVSNYQQNGCSMIIPDANGGWWISQDRATDNATIPALIHVNAAGTADYNSSGDLGGRTRGAIALNAEQSLLISVGTGYFRVWDISWDASTGAPSLTQKYQITSDLPDPCYNIVLDVAGNIYGTSNAKPLVGFALPKAENTFTTPAPAASVLTLENTIPTPQIQLTTQYTKTDYSWNAGNASRDATVYDGKVYAIDNTGKIHVIDGATGEEDVAGLITNAALNCFSISSDGAGKLYVPTGNTGGGSTFSISTVDLLNANTVTTLAYALEGGTVGSGTRSDYIEVYKVDNATTYIAGPSTNATPHLRIWSADGTTVSAPLIATEINAGNNNTGGDITWIDATHLITTGQSNPPRYVTIDPAAGTAINEPIGTATTPYGGSAYFVLNDRPYLVLTDGGLGAIKVFDITDRTAPEEVASAPAFGTASNATIHVGIEAFVTNNVATIYVWSPNNGLAVHTLTDGPVGIATIKAEQAITIWVRGNELEVKTAGDNLAGYALYGIDGRLVRSGKAKGTSASIAISNLPQGVYVLQVNTSAGVIAKKFMKR